MCCYYYFFFILLFSCPLFRCCCCCLSCLFCLGSSHLASLHLKSPHLSSLPSRAYRATLTSAFESVIVLTMKLAMRCVSAGSSASLECIRKLVGERYVSKCISARKCDKTLIQSRLSARFSFPLFFSSISLLRSAQGGSCFTVRDPEKQVSETRVVQLHFTAQ